MEIKKVKIGNITTKNNLFLAPLAGYSDAALRVVCSDFGAGLCFTEMVSCKGLKYSPKKSQELLFTYDSEEIKACQIFGNDPDIMGEIACSDYLKKFDIIDINMGCPAPKIVKNKEREISNDAITLVKYKDEDVLPITLEKYKRIMIVYIKGAPGPMDDLIKPDFKVPASVTPRCSG